MKLSIAALFFLIQATICFSQLSNTDLVWDFPQISGLNITDIKQDKTGFLWVGTNDGLYRYDGYNFKLYEPEHKKVGSSIINTIYIDSNDDIWVGTRGGLLLYNETKDQLTTFTHDPKDARTIGNNNINAIVEDKDHDLWLALSKGGLDLYKRSENSFHHFVQGDGSGLSDNDLSDVHIDNDNNLWVSTWHFGVNKVSLNNPSNKIPGKTRFTHYGSTYFGKDVTIDFIYEDVERGELYVATNGDGLFQFNKKTNSFTFDFTATNLPLHRIKLTSATQFGPSKIFLCTDEDIRILNLDDRIMESTEAPLNEIRQVKLVFIDKDKQMWIGTAHGLVKSVEKKIRHYKFDETKNITSLNNTTTLLKQGKYLWIGTWAGGLYLKDEESGKSIRVNASSELLEATWALKLINDDKTLLIATHRGIAKLDVENISLKSTFPQVDFYAGYHHFTCLSNNRKGVTWVGTWDGSLYTVDYNSGEIKKFNGYSTKNHLVQAILLDRKNQLWIGTRFTGLIRLSNIDHVVQPTYYSERSSPPNQISNDGIVALHEDRVGKIWAGSQGGGINIIDADNDSIHWIVKGEHQLPSNNIKAFASDKKGNIWISTQFGISRYDRRNGFTNYGKEDGLEFMNFNYNSVTQSDSILYFGSEGGYNAFNPIHLEFKNDPEVFITDFRINNKPFVPGSMDELESDINGSINYIKELELNYKASNISFEFSTLDFTTAPREIYAYKLEGVSDNWTATNSSNRRVNYSNLSPGKYTFRVKVIRDNSKPDDQGRAIEIIIIPPFWQTLWFQISIGLVFISLLYSAHRIRLERINKQKIKFEKLADERIKVIEKKNLEIQYQNAKLHEADKSKLDFFTNLSHEFRTPLTLIIGPIASILENHEQNDDNLKLSMIQRNAQRLLRLMDQIMDVTKLDAGNLVVEMESGDIISFIKNIANSFTYVADTKKIQYECKTNLNAYTCDFDHDKIEKVMYNLLSNAFKATPQYGVISIFVEIRDGAGSYEKNLHVEVANSGIGIRKEDLPRLFTRFYRTKNYSDGTGLGLFLTKSLIELLGGTIAVTSEENVGTSFYVNLPLSQQLVTDEHRNGFEKTGQKSFLTPFKDVEEETPIKISLISNAKTVLIVDDDDDMRRFISGLLEPSYSVIRASTGEDAVKFAYEYQPDLIISDMMMPGMDGYEFMRTIKKDANVSHIPIILLTGKASIEARLQGLEEGADDYITKPFHEKILLARVKNLIEQRRMMKERFSTDLELKPKEMTITTVDEKFMQSLIDLVETNIAEPDFNTEIICRELGIGRSYLYSKIKAITDLSVNEFIKTIRLKKAALLLQTTDQNVNEVAAAVGFNDRSHFSKSFTKHFGLAPVQFQKQTKI